MTASDTRPRRLAMRERATRLLTFLALCCLESGCKLPLDMSNLKSPNRSEERLADVDGFRNPLNRILQTVGRGREEAAHRNYRPVEGVAALGEAETLFHDGEYKQAEKAFKRVAKAYPDSQIEEDALFMLAESRYAQKKYSWAEEGYVALLEKYPSTRYMNRTTQRLFTIGRIWLGIPQPEVSGEIQQVDFGDPQQAPPEKDSRFELTRAVPILPNFTDRTRPVFDTEGRALDALREIWLKDPTGPLADDALMLTASHYLRKEDYREAARVYDILREQYPKSPHLENAFVLGSHTRLMSYQGPEYDGKALDEAQQLKQSTLQVFPNSKERQRLQEDLHNIREAKAERDWEMVVFYEKKGKPRAVAIYCRQILENFPDTSFADRARAKLDVLRTQSDARPPLIRRMVFAGERRSPADPETEPDIPVITDPEPQYDIPIITDPDPGPDIPVITDPPGESRSRSAEPPGFGRRLLERLPGVGRLLRAPGSDERESDLAGRAVL